MSLIIPPGYRAGAQLFIEDQELARLQDPLGDHIEGLLQQTADRLARMLADHVKGGRATQAEQDAVARAMTVERRADAQANAVAVVAGVRCPPLPPQGSVAHLQGGPADGAVRALPDVREVVIPVVGTAAARYVLAGYDLMCGHYIYTYEETDQ